MLSKKCKGCNLIKSFGSFSKHPQMVSGCLNNCKRCVKLQNKKRTQKRKTGIELLYKKQKEETHVKKCRECKITKSVYYGFTKASHTLDGRKFICKSCCKAINNAYTKPFREYHEHWKRNNTCVDAHHSPCRGRLEFDHVQELKLNDVSKYLFWNKHGLEVYKNEFLKGSPRCQFHHRVKTQSERHNPDKQLSEKAKYIREKVKSNRKYVRDIKVKRGCSSCGFKACGSFVHAHYYFDFDHLPEFTKTASLSRMCGQLTSKTRFETLDKEIEKCQVCCLNCHNKLTKKRRLNKVCGGK